MNGKATRLVAITACLVLILGAGVASAATQLGITFTSSGTPVANGQVVLFFSNGTASATTDQAGLANFSIDSGRGFWIEVNGQRLARFYTLDQAPSNIDVASVGTIVWRGRR